MERNDGISEFLTTRRGRLSPEQAGLPRYGTKRRVSGLRREEVSMLAGISVEYYTRIERGNIHGVSDDVLDGVARALQLDEAERSHLFDLVRASSPNAVAPRRPPQDRVRPSVQQVLDSITAPAYVRNERLDVLAANPLGEALYAPVFDAAAYPINVARFLFLDPNARAFYLDWNTVARDAVAVLRSAAGRNPYDKRLTDLIGELSTRSDEFRVRWANHDVKFHRTGSKRFHHPVVGELTLNFEALELAADPGQRLNVYTAEPGSPSHAALALLASWVATPSQSRGATS